MARFIAMKDGTLYLAHGAKPSFPPTSPPPLRLQPESAPERSARLRTLALAQARVAQGYKEFAAVAPVIEWYAVQVQHPTYPSGITSATIFLVNPQGTRVGGFHVATASELFRFGGYAVWSPKEAKK